MLSFGWSEIALIFIIIIIVIGPKELPNLLRQLGNFSKSLKKASKQFKDSLNDLADDKNFKDIKDSLNNVSDTKKALDPSKSLKKEISSIKDTITFADKEIKDINKKINKD